MSVVPAAARRIAKGEADNFTGEVLLDILVTAEGESLLGATSVTFMPGARSVWHRHVNRQVLIVTAGWGVLQFEGRPPQRLQPCDVAAIEPEAVHWHGAASDSTLTHLALLEADEGDTTWMHPVDDGAYNAAGEAVRAVG